MHLDHPAPARPGTERARALGALVAALLLLAAHPSPSLASRSPARPAARGCVSGVAPCTAAAPACPAPMASAPATLAPGSAAMWIARDPETGEWTLAPIGAAGLEAASPMALNQSDVGLVEEPVEGGGYVIRLQGRFQSYSVASRGLDGVLTSGCVNDLSGLAWWLDGRLPAPTASPSATEK